MSMTSMQGEIVYRAAGSGGVGIIMRGGWGPYARSCSWYIYQNRNEDCNVAGFEAVDATSVTKRWLGKEATVGG